MVNSNCQSHFIDKIKIVIEGSDCMIWIYYHTNDPSKRKAVKWLTAHRLSVNERNIEKQPLTQAEIFNLLSKSINGTADLISSRSRDTKALKLTSENLTINRLVRTIQKNPHVLKNPIICDENKLVTGFDQEKMGIFISQQERKDELADLLLKQNLQTNHFAFPF
nr:ArsC/Spx/MgsR family protein [Limosilactobacillus avistercoris]